MYKKEIVILAKSSKHGQFCIAGKDLCSFKWSRLVSDPNGGPIKQENARVTNFNWTKSNRPPYECKLLHKVIITFERPVPLLHQPENELITSEVWIQNFKFPKNQLDQIQDTPSNLWGNGNRILYESIPVNNENYSSLYLIKVNNVEIYLVENNKTRINFFYNSIFYENMPVTDPQFYNIVSPYKSDSAFLVVSLGEIYKNYCYKIIAAIYI